MREKKKRGLRIRRVNERERKKDEERKAEKVNEIKEKKRMEEGDKEG